MKRMKIKFTLAVLVICFSNEVVVESIASEIPSSEVLAKHSDYGEKLLRDGDPERALQHFNYVLHFRKSAAVLIARASALKKLRRYKESLADLDAAIKFDPDGANGYCERGCVLAKLGAPDVAITEINIAIKKAPNDPEIISARGSVYLFEFENYPEAIADFSKAIELDPQRWCRYAMRALGHYVSGNDTEAIRDNSTAIGLMNSDTPSTDRARVHFARHKSYERIGAKRQSDSDLAQARRLDESVLR